MAIALGQMAIVGILVARNAWIDARLRRLRARSKLLADIFDEMGAADTVLLRQELGRREILTDLRTLEGWLDLVVTRGADPARLSPAEYEATGLVERYLEALRHERRWTRRAAAAEILGWTGSPRAVPALLATALDTVGEPPAVRHVAIRSLQRIRHEDAAQPLIDALATSETWFLPRAASALVNIGTPAVAPLLRELTTPGRPASNRRWAAHVLGEIGDRRALRPLHDALADVDPELRSRAAKALGELRHPSSVGPLLERLLGDPSSFVRTSVARALGQLPTRETVEFLARSLSDPEWWVRQRVVESLANLGSPARDALRGALHDRDPLVAREAARGLERMGAVAEAIDALRTEGYTPEVTELLHDVGKTGSLDGLLDGLRDPDPAVVTQLTRTLGRIGDPAAGPALAELLSRTPEAPMQARILEALHRVGAHGFDREVGERLASPDEFVRRAALGYLEDLGDRRRPPDVIPLLSDADPGVRRAALRWVERVNPPGFPATTLVPALHDPDTDVRAAGASALAAVGRHDLILANGVADADDLVVSTLIRGIVGGAGPSSLDLALALFPRTSLRDLDRLAAAVRDVARTHPQQTRERLHDPADVAARWARAVAAVALEAAEPPADVRSLLADEDPRVRAAAVPAATPECAMACAGDPSPLVASAVIRALAAVPGAEAEASVLAAAHSGDRSVVVDAAFALALRGALRGPGADALDAAAVDPECRLAILAGRLLQGDEDAMPAWLESLQSDVDVETARGWRRDGHPLFARVLERAVEAGAPFAARLLPAESAYAAETLLLRDLDASPEAEVRLACVRGLRWLESRRAEGVLLGVCLMDPSPRVRTHALEFLVTRTRLPQKVGVLEHALRDPDETVSVLAARKLEELPAAEAIPLLLRHIETRRTKFFEAVTDSLARLADAHGPAILRAILARPENERALRALAAILAKRADDPPPDLAATLLTHRFASVRAYAAARLGPRLPEAAPLFDALRDPAASVRLAALRALSTRAAGSGVDRAAPPGRLEAAWVQALRDPSPRVRMHAVRAVAADGPAAAREELRRLERGENSRVAAAARRALERMAPRPAATGGDA